MDYLGTRNTRSYTHNEKIYCDFQFGAIECVSSYLIGFYLVFFFHFTLSAADYISFCALSIEAIVCTQTYIIR